MANTFLESFNKEREKREPPGVGEKIAGAVGKAVGAIGKAVGGARKPGDAGSVKLIERGGKVSYDSRDRPVKRIGKAPVGAKPPARKAGALPTVFGTPATGLPKTPWKEYVIQDPWEPTPGQVGHEVPDKGWSAVLALQNAVIPPPKPEMPFKKKPGAPPRPKEKSGFGAITLDDPSAMYENAVTYERAVQHIGDVDRQWYDKIKTLWDKPEAQLTTGDAYVLALNNAFRKINQAVTAKAWVFGANVEEQLAKEQQYMRDMPKLSVVRDIEERQAARAKDGMSGALQMLMTASDVVSDPVQYGLPMLAETFAAFAPGLAGAALAPGVAGPAALYAWSQSLEFGGRIMEELEKAKVDTTDPAALRAAKADPAIWGPAYQNAFKGSAAIGMIDAATAGIASKGGAVVRRAAATGAAKAGLGRTAAHIGSQFLEKGAQAGVEMIGGGGGEIAGALLQGNAIDWTAVAHEMILELGTGPAEVAAIGVSAKGKLKSGMPWDSLTLEEQNYTQRYLNRRYEALSSKAKSEKLSRQETDELDAIVTHNIVHDDPGTRARWQNYLSGSRAIEQITIPEPGVHPAVTEAQELLGIYERYRSLPAETKALTETGTAIGEQELRILEDAQPFSGVPTEREAGEARPGGVIQRTREAESAEDQYTTIARRIDEIEDDLEWKRYEDPTDLLLELDNLEAIRTALIDHLSEYADTSRMLDREITTERPIWSHLEGLFEGLSRPSPHGEGAMNRRTGVRIDGPLKVYQAHDVQSVLQEIASEPWSFGEPPHDEGDFNNWLSDILRGRRGTKFINRAGEKRDFGENTGDTWSSAEINELKTILRERYEAVMRPAAPTEPMNIGRVELPWPDMVVPASVETEGGARSDREDVEGLQGAERAGEEPGRAVPDEERGGEAAEAGGVVQAEGEEVEAAEPEPTAESWTDEALSRIEQAQAETLDEIERLRQQAEESGTPDLFGERGSAPLDPLNTELLGAYARYGALEMAKTGLGIAKWTEGMVAKFGEEIRPYIARIYDASLRIYREQIKPKAKRVQRQGTLMGFGLDADFRLSGQTVKAEPKAEPETKAEDVGQTDWVEQAEEGDAGTRGRGEPEIEPEQKRETPKKKTPKKRERKQAKQYKPESLEDQAFYARKSAEQEPHFDALRAANREEFAAQQEIDEAQKRLPEGYTLQRYRSRGVAETTSSEEPYFYVQDPDGNQVGRYPLTEAEATVEAWAEAGQEPPGVPEELLGRLEAARQSRSEASRALDEIEERYGSPPSQRQAAGRTGIEAAMAGPATAEAATAEVEPTEEATPPDRTDGTAETDRTDVTDETDAGDRMPDTGYGTDATDVTPTGRKKPIAQRDVVTALVDAFNQPHRQGRFGGRVTKMAGGFFSSLTGISRARNMYDIEVASHEIGHGLNKRYGWDKANEGEYQSELMRYGDPADLGPRSSWTENESVERRLSEGVAEFTRLYLADPETTRANAPKFAAEFDGALEREGLLDAFHEAQRMYQEWRRQTATQKLRAQTDYSGEVSAQSEGGRWWHGFRADVIDNLYKLRQVEERIFGRPVEQIEESGYIKARQSRGSAARADHMLLHGRGSAMGLAEILKLSGDRTPNQMDFQDYARLRSLKAWHDIGRGTAGLTIVEIEAGIRELETPEFLHAFDELQKYFDELNEVEREFHTPEILESRRQNDEYVPNTRVLEAGIGEGRIEPPGSASRSLANQQLQDPRYEGISQATFRPWKETVIERTYNAFQKQMQNDAALTFIGNAQQGAGPALFEEVPMALIPHDALGEMKTVMDRYETAAGTPADLIDLAAAIDALPPEMFDMTYWQRVNRLTNGQKADRIIMVMSEGRPKFYQVLDPTIYEALVGMGPMERSFVMRIASIPANTLRAGVTLDPGFLFYANLIRDSLSSWMVSSRKSRFLPGWDTARGMKQAVKGGKTRDLWVEYGGALSTTGALDRATVRKHAEHIGAQKIPGADDILDGIRRLRDASEAANRLPTFERELAAVRRAHPEWSREAQYEHAAYKARDLLDFAMRGRLSQKATYLIAFARSTINGLAKMGHEIAADPWNIALRGAPLVMASALLFAMHKDDDDYWELPGWERDNYWHIKKPNGEFQRIPKPFEWGWLFATLPEHSLRRQQMEDPRAFDTTMKALIDVTMVDMPNGLQLALDLAGNRQSFTGAPIVPDYLAYGSSAVRPEDQVKGSTSPAMKRIGKLLGVSPAKIEYAAHQLGGPSAQYANTLVDWMLEPLTGQPPLRSSNPLRRMTTHVNAYPYLYDELRTIEQRVREDANSVKREETTKARDARARELGYKNYASLNDRKRALGSAVKAIYELQDKYYEAKTDTERRKRRAEIQTAAKRYLKQAGMEYAIPTGTD